MDHDTERELATLVGLVHALNQTWKRTVEAWGKDAPAARTLQQLKGVHQVRLLRAFPGRVSLAHDPSDTAWSVRVDPPVKAHWNAAHLPEHVARDLLTVAELAALAPGAE